MYVLLLVLAFAQELSNKNIDSRRLAIDTASHCRLVEPILEEFTRYVEKLPFRQPQLPYMSNVTGCWITDEDLASPQYWVKHLRHTIRFSDGITLLLENAKQVILEVGPQTLSGLIRQQISKDKQTQVLSSIRHPQEQESDVASVIGLVLVKKKPLKFNRSQRDKSQILQIGFICLCGKKFYLLQQLTL